MEHIVFTVTNDLVFDQRMNRICGSLARHGYQVLLTGRKLSSSPPLPEREYSCKRIRCFFRKGKMFYAEYNLRLFFYLLFLKTDCICAIDLDTILPCYLVSRIRRKKRVYDAHEYFSQLHEVINRPGIFRIWHWLERTMIPRFENGYTVCRSIANEFQEKYGADYHVIRNVPVESLNPPATPDKNIILYQGAVNHGRGLDQLALAMKSMNGTLWICGGGNYMVELKKIVAQNNLSGKVVFHGMLPPEELKRRTAAAGIAVNPFESKGLNQYLSLSNKFFDYIHACIPQVTMNYPEYRHINSRFEVAVLIDQPVETNFVKAVDKLQTDEQLYQRLQQNCLLAKSHYNWQQEEKKLVTFYKQLFNGEY